jgi:hypothetical protein
MRVGAHSVSITNREISLTPAKGTNMINARNQEMQTRLSNFVELSKALNDSNVLMADDTEATHDLNEEN